MDFFKNLFGKSEEHQYGICTTSCDCQLNQEIDNSVDYKVHKGCLVKLFEYNSNHVVLSLFTDKLKLATPNDMHFDLIEFKLFKYLNAINDLDERFEFYKNDKRREFVINLEKGAIVSVEYLELQVLGIFHDIIEENTKIFITVELLTEPKDTLFKTIKEKANNSSSKDFIYSLPANMINRDNITDEDQIKEKKVNIDQQSETSESSGCGNTVRNFKFSSSSDQRREPDLIKNSNKNINTYVLPDKSTWECHLKEDKHCLQCMTVNGNDSYDLIFETGAQQLNPAFSSYDKKTIYCEKEIKIHSRIQQVKQPSRSSVDEAFSFFMGKGCSQSPGISALPENDIIQKSATSNLYSDINSDAGETLSQSNSLNLNLDTQINKAVQAVNTKLINNSICAICFTTKDKTGCSKCDKQQMPTKNEVTSWNCEECLNTNENNSNVCLKCDCKNVKILEQVNPQIDVNPTLTVLPQNPLENDKISEPNNYITNGTKNLTDICEITVLRNSSVTECTICNNTLIESQGFILRLCQHTVCETCIKSQFESEKLNCPVFINNKLCGQSFELSEIKYFFTSYQFERIQQCYNKKCRGYHLWEKDNKNRPIEFNCNICKLNNCLQCGVMHDGLTCESFGQLTNGGKSLELDVVLSYIRNVTAKSCSNCESSGNHDKTDHICCGLKPLSSPQPQPAPLLPPPPPPPPPPFPPPPPPSSSISINKNSNLSKNKIKLQKNPNDDLMDELRKKLTARRSVISEPEFDSTVSRSNTMPASTKHRKLSLYDSLEGTK